MRQLPASLFLVLLLGATMRVEAVEAVETGDIEQLLRGGQAQQAYQLAQSRAAAGMGDPYFDYLLGWAALESGQAGQAVFALERVLMTQPQNQRARLTLARAHLQLENYASARAEFNTVLQAHPSDDEKQSIKQYLAEIDRNTSKRSKRVQAHLELVAGRDR